MSFAHSQAEAEFAKTTLLLCFTAQWWDYT